MTEQLLAIIKKKPFSILLGKNGAGKSSLLRALDQRTDIESVYITPERGGVLKYNPGVDSNLASSSNWITDSRRVNRFEQFREQAAVRFRRLELSVLREIETDTSKRKDHSYTFEQYLCELNILLPHVSLKRSENGFTIVSKSGDIVPEENISSGESELIALAIEVLIFARDSKSERFLLLDEPDVHLHPDLQQRLVQFIEKLALGSNFKVVIATHSTAIVGSFDAQENVTIIPVDSKFQATFKPFSYDKILSNILPIFGTHPLSSHFNNMPVLLVEGDDDKRVIEQIVRSSNGKVKLSPCDVGSVNMLHKWEVWLSEYLPALYDNPRGYSLRDLDSGNSSVIDDIGCVKRAKLNCYSIENMLLTKESLDEHELSEEDFCEKLRAWASSNLTNKYRTDVESLADNFNSRRIAKLKSVRNIIVAILGSSKPWEVIVGQILAGSENSRQNETNSVRDYMGDRFYTFLWTQ